nr:ABC transporter substrate-binding protein [Bacteroidales bacterium]
MKKAGLLILVLGLLFSACGRKTTEDESLAIFKYNEVAGILSLDPIYAKDLAHIWACNQVFSSLVAFDDKMNIVPRVAKSWDISEDGTVYTFHLRDDVPFHQDPCFTEPRCVTAEDFVYSFNRVVDKHLNSPGMWIFSSVRHDDDHYAFEAVDDTTFRIELSKPFPPFMGILSMTFASVVPKEAVEYYGDEFRSHPVGTGPFKFQYWKEGVKLVFRKNP